ncbi:MAG: DNA starvation/stationary phase protection protein Dps [Phycisphaerales bacterium]
MHKTRHDLSKDVRKKAIGLLQARLADALSLVLACKQAHWTTRGPGFASLHKFFDELADGVEGHADEIAERITALGGQPHGTVEAGAGQSSLKPYPLDLVQETRHLEALADRFAAFGASVRADIDRSDKLGEAGTADLFTQVSRAVDKALWMIEAHSGKNH